MHRLCALVALVPSAVLVAACGSSSSSGAGGGSYCAAAQTVKSDETALTAAFGPSTTITQLQGILSKFTTDVDAADGAAPSVIASDWHSIRSTLDTANTGVQKATTLDQAGQALVGLSNNDQAGQRIDVETQKECGFIIGTPTPAPGGGSTSTSSSSTSTDTGASSSSSTDTGTSTSTTSS